MREYTKAYSERGASMGRVNTNGDPDFDGTLTIELVPLDSGGYDPGGAYWGAPDPNHGVHSLYTAYDANGEVDVYFRAKDREAAVKHVLEAYPKAIIAPVVGASDEFFASYVETALWSTTYAADNDGNPVDPNDTANYSDIPLGDNFDRSDIDEETLAKMIADCDDFVNANAETLEKLKAAGHQTDERAGHNFWLNRNGHGAGFWDEVAGTHALAPLFDKLSEASKAYGSFYLYVGDDGKVYGS